MDTLALRANRAGPEGAAHRIDTLAAAIHAERTAEQLYDMDLAYAPPFGPSWSPLLLAASQLSKDMTTRAGGVDIQVRFWPAINTRRKTAACR